MTIKGDLDIPQTNKIRKMLRRNVFFVLFLALFQGIVYT